ncbi:TPA: hypothetical protein HA239_05175 [Candidatus Woesearchaeota archaeon]|nr:hypothetical protein QT06_C0001G0306 [archaeon GW2011_AR15]MBS3103625.1 hypothetical protein [Candidatus Woesearchaeota archaeon]HIH41775.1 hypothetical protein [Candidatus Woesearchaeota archaeon]
MITCTLEISENVGELYKVFLSEKLQSDRASCRMTKGRTLKFEIEAKDPVSMRAFTNSILRIIETHEKISRVK